MSSRGVGPLAIIIPAFNEEAVIGRTLGALGMLTAADDVEVVVVANGCTDGTATVARKFADVRVIELETGNKAAALNAGDSTAQMWPRVYLDSDIEASCKAISEVCRFLRANPHYLAARPNFEYRTRESSSLVKAYYRARVRAEVGAHSLWGAGCYALSEEGHRRLGQFPDLHGDDFVVDSLFSEHEKHVVVTESPLIVRVPLTSLALLSVLKRVYAGNAAVDGGVAARRGVGIRRIIASIASPLDAWDAAVFAAFAIGGRLYRLTGGAGHSWHRDLTSR